MKKIVLVGALFTLLLASCNKGNETKTDSSKNDPSEEQMTGQGREEDPNFNNEEIGNASNDTKGSGAGAYNERRTAEPNKSMMVNDLVGMTIKDVTGGYFGSSWSWTIEQGDIKGFSIVDKKPDQNKYNVKVDLQRRGGKIQATLDLYYLLNNNGEWIFHDFTTKDLTPTKNDRYMDLIEITKKNYNSMSVHNIAGKETYRVTGKKKEPYGNDSDHYKKFSVILTPNEEKDLFAEDIIIEYVDLPETL